MNIFPQTMLPGLSVIRLKTVLSLGAKTMVKQMPQNTYPDSKKPRRRGLTKSIGPPGLFFNTRLGTSLLGGRIAPNRAS